MKFKAFALAACAALLALPAAGADEKEQLSEQEIIDRLVQQLNGIKSRGFAPRATDASADPVYEAPEVDQRVDIRITFDIDSDVLRPDQAPNLSALCGALQDSALSAAQVMLIGHTDARGDEAYNQNLSERRARAVLGHLSSDCGIQLDRMDATGQGEYALLDQDDPNNEVNRRVEVQISGRMP